MKRLINVVTKTVPVLIAVIAMLFCSVPVGEIAVSADSTSISALESKIKKLQQEQAELKTKIAGIKNDIDSAEGNKQYIDSLVSATQGEIDATEELIVQYSDKISAKETDIANMEAALAESFEEFKTHLRKTYEDSNTSYIEMLLESDDFVNFLMSLERVGIMLEYEQSLMDKMNEQLETLNAEKADLGNSKKAQENLLLSLDSKRRDLSTQAAKAETYLDSLVTNEEELEAQQKKIAAAEAALNSELEKKLAELARSQGASNYTQGELLWPLPVSNSRVSSPFGARWGATHYGIDIPAAFGTSIYAANAGTVIVATSHYSYGNYIIVDHGGGITTIYAHCSSLLVSVGATVSRGQTIGRVGATGNAQGNHLHFEVRNKGVATNPLNGWVNQP